MLFTKSPGKVTKQIDNTRIYITDCISTFDPEVVGSNLGLARMDIFIRKVYIVNCTCLRL